MATMNSVGSQWDMMIEALHSPPRMEMNGCSSLGMRVSIGLYWASHTLKMCLPDCGEGG